MPSASDDAMPQRFINLNASEEAHRQIDKLRKLLAKESLTGREPSKSDAVLIAAKEAIEARKATKKDGKG